MLTDTCHHQANSFSDFAVWIRKHFQEVRQCAEDDFLEALPLWAFCDRAEGHQGGIFVLPVWHLNICSNKCNNVVNDFTFEEECDFLKGASSRQRMSPVFIILILVEVDDKEALSDQVQEKCLAASNVALARLLLSYQLHLFFSEGGPELVGLTSDSVAWAFGCIASDFLDLTKVEL